MSKFAVFVLYVNSHLAEELTWKDTTKLLLHQVMHLIISFEVFLVLFVHLLNFCFFQTSPCPTEPLLLKCQIIPAQVFPLKASQFTRMCKPVSIICSIVWVKPNTQHPVNVMFI